MTPLPNQKPDHYPLRIKFDFRDWPEDFGHENGNYCNKCVECGLEFCGNKRRCICKECAFKKFDLVM